jgi:transcriptional regulator with XRE-family HTH domain
MTQGEAIRELREERDWTQKDLAEEMGVTTNTVARWERDELNMSAVSQRLFWRIAGEEEPAP